MIKSLSCNGGTLVVTICKEPIIVIETVEMLYRFTNGIGFDSIKTDFIRKHSAKKNDGWVRSVEERTAALSGIMARVCGDMDPKDSLLQYYFSGYSYASPSDKCCLAQLMTWILAAYTPDFDGHISALKAKWLKKLGENDSVMLSPGISFEYDSNDKWRAELVDRIDALQYPEEFRWRLFKLISNPQYYIDELADLIRPIAQKLSCELLKLNTEACAFEQYWNEYFDTHSLQDFSLSFCHVDSEFTTEQELFIYIGFMNPTAVISEMGSNSQEKWCAQVGWFLDDEITRTSNNMLIDEICDILKVLSDKSKFAILRETNSAPRYGAELAEQLGLTGATISRHMNTLFNCGFITAEKNNTKVYYRTNKERLAEFLITLHDELLK